MIELEVCRSRQERRGWAWVVTAREVKGRTWQWRIGKIGCGINHGQLFFEEPKKQQNTGGDEYLDFHLALSAHSAGGLHLFHPKPPSRPPCHTKTTRNGYVFTVRDPKSRLMPKDAAFDDFPCYAFR